MDDLSQNVRIPDPANRQQAIGKTITRYTVSQPFRYFAADLPRSCNYPRHARAYVGFCLKHQVGVDGFSFTRYTAGLPPNRSANREGDAVKTGRFRL